MTCVAVFDITSCVMFIGPHSVAYEPCLNSFLHHWPNSCCILSLFTSRSSSKSSGYILRIMGALTLTGSFLRLRDMPARMRGPRTSFIMCSFTSAKESTRQDSTHSFLSSACVNSALVYVKQIGPVPQAHETGASIKIEDQPSHTLVL